MALMPVYYRHSLIPVPLTLLYAESGRLTRPASGEHTE